MNALINYLIDYYGERTRVITGKIKNDITVSERKLEVLKKTEERLQLQLKDMQKNTADILRHRDALLTDEEKDTDTLALLLYSNTIQQNVSYMDQLYQLIEENGMQQKDLQQNIGDLMLQLSRGGKSTGKDILDKGQFEGLIVVQKPIVDPKRVKPNRTLIVALAGVLGIFLGVFVAFFREFWENQKELRAQA
jgi:LPS O-antigen subunit length determinant protein (WzzB/FepE family)